MLQVNNYFSGSVKSILVENEDGMSTIGVISKGEYEIGASTIENMTIMSGVIHFLFDNEKEWKTYKTGDSLIIPKDMTMKVKADMQVAYFTAYN